MHFAIKAAHSNINDTACCNIHISFFGLNMQFSSSQWIMSCIKQVILYATFTYHILD